MAKIELFLMDKENQFVKGEAHDVAFTDAAQLPGILWEAGNRLAHSTLRGVRVHLLCNRPINPFCMYDVWTSVCGE